MNPKYITLHSSATLPDMKYDKDWLWRVHVVGNGWGDIGYHYMIDPIGAIHRCRPITKTGAHVKGHNKDNIGIVLIGGVDSNQKPVDNYTSDQKHAARRLIEDLQSQYQIPIENVKGHRDWYGDTNGDGVIDRRDWMKDCPCFDVQEWLKDE